MLEINLKQLESFVATVEHSGFTAAAAALYLTQSTVSAHVSALEQTLGVPLLVRGARSCFRDRKHYRYHMNSC